MKSTAVCICALTVFVGFAPQARAGDVEDTIYGIVSRAHAVVSGRIAFVCKYTNFAGDRVLQSTALPEAVTSFSEASWAERTSKGSVVAINHNGYFLDYAATPQPNGSVHFRVGMLPPRMLASRNEENVPPIFAGSIWKSWTLEYVSHHVEKIQSVRRDTVNGLQVEVYDLAVPAEDHRHAFVTLLPKLHDGGTIRLFVARQLGFVLPRYEFLTPEGAVAKSFSARDFDEVSPGVFFPRHIDEDVYLASGSPDRFHAEFDIRAELINQPIPEEDFVIQLPVGTDVNDGRDAEHVVAFRITDASLSSALSDLSFGISGRKPPGFFERWMNAILTGIGLAAVFAVACFLVVWHRRRVA